MIKSDFKKKIADSWFSYLQTQICKEFELLENKIKFSKENGRKRKKRRWRDINAFKKWKNI